MNAAFVVCFYLAFACWRAPWWVLICLGFDLPEKSHSVLAERAIKIARQLEAQGA